MSTQKNRSKRSILLLLAIVPWSTESVEGLSVRLSVQEPSGVSRSGWPVSSGVPFAQGALRDTGYIALLDNDGRETPLQTEVLASWPDGSVRWLLVDFQVDLAASETKTFDLRHASDVRRSVVADPVRVAKTAAQTTIDTGPLRLNLQSDGFDPFGSVLLDVNGDGRFAKDERVTDGGGGFYVVDTRSEGFLSTRAPAEIVVEQSGPLRACVRVSGRHASGDDSMFRYVVRIHAFRGKPFVRCFYTFINDHQDSLMASIEQLGLGAQLAKEVGEANHGLLDGREAQMEMGSILQVDESHYRRDGRAAGSRAAGWAGVGASRAGFAVGLGSFWQNWPKSVEVGQDRVVLGICPRIPKGLYDGKPLDEENKLYYALRNGVHTFKVGVAKTHELWATFFAGKPDVGRLSRFFRATEEPLLATCEPAYVNSTGAAGDLPPADRNKFFGYDAWFAGALDAHLKRRDQVREYGMLNYGDWFGERRVNWGNLEYDLAHGMFLQYVRTGDRRFFERGEQAAQHHIDIDIVHATNPHLKNPWGAPPQAGQIWLHCLNHAGGYYTDSPLPVSRTYHMGHSTNYGHVWISGDLDYYYLTGDRRAREVALMAADAMVRAMPTSYGTHIRALGWPMILVLAAYEATGESRYLEAATKNWQVLRENIDWDQGWVVRLASDHCLHPQGSTRQEREKKYRDQRCRGNVPFMEGLTLSALARYHRRTNDPEVLKAITVGIDQMIRECWQEDVKTFRYTACPLSSPRPYGLFMLSVEALAYEAQLTGNREHLRILREGFRAAIANSGSSGSGKSLAQMTFFAPHALGGIEAEQR
ncbi:MAG: hypothetical protein JSU70_19560 [Phycisphaerales bacterium]|nr:MAG: hypothetical protein JSU70_19560 [Phycisphaerales bacterium]